MINGPKCETCSDPATFIFFAPINFEDMDNHLFSTVTTFELACDRCEQPTLFCSIHEWVTDWRYQLLDDPDVDHDFVHSVDRALAAPAIAMSNGRTKP